MAGEGTSSTRSAILALLVRYCLKRRFVRSAAFVWQRTRSVSSRYFRGTALDATTIDFLRQVNNNFYARCAPSFSASRNAPWVGWRSCLEAVQDCGVVRLCDGPDMHLYDRATAQPGAIRKGASVRVLDVACGNMRFAAFLREELRGRQSTTSLSMTARDLFRTCPKARVSLLVSKILTSLASLRSALVCRTQSMLNLAIWSDASGFSITFLRSSFACGSSKRFFRRRRRVVLYARRFGNSWATRSL